MEDIIKIVKSLGDLVSENEVQNEAKKQKGGFLSMLLGTSSASILGIILAGKGATAKRQAQGINRAGEGVIRAG